MLSLPRRRSNVRNVAEGIATGQQRFDGALIASTAAATPDSDSIRSIIEYQQFRFTSPTAAAARR